MTTLTDTTNRGTLVAIDIAKRQNDVLVEHPDGKSRCFKVANKLSDFQKFADYLASLPGPCTIVFEPMADYHRAIFFIAGLLIDLGLGDRVGVDNRCALFSFSDLTAELFGLPVGHPYWRGVAAFHR